MQNTFFAFKMFQENTNPKVQFGTNILSKSMMESKKNLKIVEFLRFLTLQIDPMQY